VVSIIPGASQVIHEAPQNIRRIRQAVAAYQQGGVSGVLQYNTEEGARIAANQAPIGETVLNMLPVVGTVRQAMTIPATYYREGAFFGGMAVGTVTQRTMGDVVLGAGAANAAGSYLLRDVEFGNPYSAPALADNPLLSEGGGAATIGGGIGTTMSPPGFVYRGVHARHPALTDALRGQVLPADIYGTITAEQQLRRASSDLLFGCGPVSAVQTARFHAFGVRRLACLLDI
jgi:hypothetical protein